VTASAGSNLAARLGPFAGAIPAATCSITVIAS
jgi:hypothetical protein